MSGVINRGIGLEKTSECHKGDVKIVSVKTAGIETIFFHRTSSVFLS